MTVARLADAPDAEKVGRILAAGFADDPVLTWVFHQPDRAAKLVCFFDFLAREALVPLGATYLLQGELGPKLQRVVDAQTFTIGALANLQGELEDEDAKEVVRSALEEQKALAELLTGREPELIDPSLFELDDDDPDEGRHE